MTKEQVDDLIYRLEKQYYSQPLWYTTKGFSKYISMEDYFKNIDIKKLYKLQESYN